MPLPPNPTAENSLWWSNFFRQYGRDSAHEAAFLGYLSTRGWHAHGLSAAELDQAWINFTAFVETSAQPQARQRR
jgi:hypothetical protein